MRTGFLLGLRFGFGFGLGFHWKCIQMVVNGSKGSWRDTKWCTVNTVGRVEGIYSCEGVNHSDAVLWQRVVLYLGLGMVDGIGTGLSL